jgi:hypothetical protein
MDVSFFFDPSCAWAWPASRWLAEVSTQRAVHLTWCSYSKLLGCDIRGLPDQQLLERVASHRVLRVIEAVRHEQPNAVRRLYGALARQAERGRAYRRLPFSDADVRAALTAAGLDPRYSGAALQERWDEAIVASMETAHTVLGERADTPAVVLALPDPVGFNCPKISPMPTGSAALALWDARVARAGRVPAATGPGVRPAGAVAGIRLPGCGGRSAPP